MICVFEEGAYNALQQVFYCVFDAGREISETSSSGAPITSEG